MSPRLTFFLICATLGAVAASPAAARPYLILSADQTGFLALDLGNVRRMPEGPDALDHTIVDRSPPPPPKPQFPPRPAAQTAADIRSGADAGDPYAGYARVGADADRAVTVKAQQEQARLREDRRFLNEQITIGRIIDDKVARPPRAAADARDANEAPPPVYVPDTIEVTLISAPLAGQAFGDKVAPVVERRLEVDCRRPRWRTTAIAFVDAREQLMGNATTAGGWDSFDDDDSIATAVQTAACQRTYRKTAVSRFLNLGEILANYQAAHNAGRAQPKTEKELLQDHYRAGH